MSKDPTPRADALRAQREARYGHLQATAEPRVTLDQLTGSNTLKVVKRPRKLIPYAGKDSKGEAPKAKFKPKGKKK